ncbi:MAG: hypothetical protein ACXVDJ_11245, partial [Tumebacillaceae bacterium]
MKSFYRILPFLLVFIAVFGLQTKWATDNQVKPFLEPFGRESAAGHTSVNRPVQVLDQTHFVWLGDTDLKIATVDPATQKVTTESRQAPDDDLFSHTLYTMVGDDIFWIGNQDVLKRSTWQQGKWSEPVTIAKNANSVYAVQIGKQKLLAAGLNGSMNLWTVGDKVVPLKSYKTKKVTHINGAFDAQGNLNIGAVDEIGSSIANLLFATVDVAHVQASDLSVVQNLSMPSSMTITDNAFGLDKTHGYFLVTYMNTRSMSPSLTAYDFSLATRSGGKAVPNPYDGQLDLYSAFAAPGQGDSLKFIAAGDSYKNPRALGKEVFFSTLQDGVWKKGLQRVSNSHGVAVNPTFVKQSDGSTLVLFMLQDSYEQFDIYYNSDNKTYATATNVERKADYTNAMMN